MDRYVPPVWTEQALCTQVDLHVFYPEKGESAEHGKTICRMCPVRLDCLRAAMETDERHGTWGGLTAKERTRIRVAARRELASSSSPAASASVA